jgi:3-deoxy-manno-octulosonate cytidylyltransferase (CMP-KDO synthetase)
MRSYVVIPARQASTRLPNKMLLCDTGRTLLEHTHDAALAASRPAGVIVATDHADIAREVRRFGGRAVLTSPACASGTDRVAEAIRSVSDAQIVVNLQGDEPEINPAAIDQVVELLENSPTTLMATLATPLRDPEKIADPACVKVVFDERGRALYFSRSPIPYIRDGSDPTVGTPLYHQHIGLYAYRREFLLRLATTPPSPLEMAEKLEQLRVLEMGESILVGVTEHIAHGIDTPADYAAFVARHRRRAG